MKFKKFISAAVLCATLALTCAACGEEGPVDPNKPTPPPISTDVEVYPTEYDNDEVVSISEVLGKDMDTWQREVFKKGSTANNDEVTEHALLKSPWHTLKVNGTEVPVYTARCGKGSHSFGWIDVEASEDDFVLDVELTTSKAYKKCVVLPESKEVSASLDGDKVSARTTGFGTFTFTFAKNERDEYTDPTLEPVTLFVAPYEEMVKPSSYDLVEIEPGVHGDDELEFTQGETYYVFKAGLHVISSIKIPDNSVIWLERGAYLKCEDRVSGGVNNRTTAIHTEGTENAKVLGRGLLDMGACKGGDDKYKHVYNATGCTAPVARGLTIVNSNTWTMCFYNDDAPRAEYNLLLGYRTYSDGIMMSECRDGYGAHNFVRTGDDAIEFKGTGWGGAAVGNGNVYEDNDVWTDKASAYCLTWESDCDMEGMIFRNNRVGFALPTWTPLSAPLDCRLGTNALKTWSDVLYRDIELYYVKTPNVILIQITGIGGNFANIRFANISVAHAEFGVYAAQLYLSGGGSIEDITISNYDFCGMPITEAHKDNELVVKFSKPDLKEQLTIV